MKLKLIFSVLCLFIMVSNILGQSSSITKSYAFRLKPGDDLKKGIELFVKNHNIKAAGITTCVGSLTEANIRYANQPNGKTSKGFFEILSLSGVLSTNGSHIHIAIANKNGKTIGGHLLDGNLIYTTAEIIITELSELEFKRELDSTYGYKELVVETNTKRQ